MKVGKNWNRNNKEGISYMDSMMDLMTALVLVLLLVFVLALLYIVKNPEEGFYEKPAEEVLELEEDEDGFYAADEDAGLVEDDEDPDDFSDESGSDRDDEGALNGGGDSEGGDYGGYRYEFPGNSDELSRAAVHVTVIDAETKNAILQKGIEFQLFSASSVLQVLNSYYPKKIQFEKFETEETGTYYLPEKIPQGSYYFRDLTAPKGYDLADNVSFTIDEDYDWSRPLEVLIPLYPSRNTIRLQMKDAQTMENVGRAAYDVIAAEDIVTFDGTVRLRAGEVADRLVLDEKGYGETTELFLGAYELSEVTIPRFYAGDEENLKVDLAGKGSEEDQVLEVKAEKTAYTYTIYDELNSSQPLEGVSYRVQPQNGSGKKLAETLIETDASGRILLTDLEKDTVYRLKQADRPEGYLADKTEHTFTVSERGWIGESVRESETLYSRMIRVNIGIRDMLLRKLISDYSIALEDSGLNLVQRWDSTGVVQNLTGLEPGTYYLVIRGNMSKPREIVIEDTCEVQTFYVDIWTMGSIAICVGGVCVLIGVFAILMVVKNRRKKDSQRRYGE